MYGKGEAGADVVEYLTYTVSDGIATVDYKGQKITTTKIENDTFKASLDGTEANTASFTTKANPAPADPETPVKPADPEKPIEPTDPEKPAEPTDPETPVEPTDPEKPVEPTDPETPVENPFAGKTFYGTVTEWPYDVCKLDFTSDSEVTLTLYGEGEAGADVVLDLTYTVSDGIATVDYEGQKLTTTKIENDTFKASLDGTEENTASFTTNANPAPAEPETPTILDEAGIIGGFNGYKECDLENGLICGEMTEYIDSKTHAIKTWRGPTINKKTKYFRVLIRRKK